MTDTERKKKIKEFLQAIDPNGLLDRKKAEELLEDLISPKESLPAGFRKGFRTEFVVSFILTICASLLFSSIISNFGAYDWPWYVLLIGAPVFTLALLIGVLLKNPRTATIAVVSALMTSIMSGAFLLGINPGFPGFLTNALFLFPVVYIAPVMYGLCEGIVGKTIAEYSHQCFLIKKSIQELKDISELYAIFGTLEGLSQEKETLGFKLKTLLGQAALFFSSNGTEFSEAHIFAFIIKNQELAKTDGTEKLVSLLFKFTKEMGIVQTCTSRFESEAKGFAFEKYKGMKISPKLPTKKQSLALAFIMVIGGLVLYIREPIIAFGDAHPWLAGSLVTALITVPATYFISRARARKVEEKKP